MSVETQPKLEFLGFEIKEVAYSIVKPYNKGNISVSINPKLVIHGKTALEFEKFEVLMDVKVFSEGSFEITVSLVGDFLLNLQPEDLIRENLMQQNAPAILFPYVRSFISTLTANLGGAIGTLVIPPQMFKGKIEIISSEQLPD